MPTCELCGKEFRTTQGLSGHMRWVHGSQSDAPSPAQKPNPALSFFRARGLLRMKECPHAKKGERTGKLLCWYWRFYPEADDGGLELVPIEGEKYKHAVVVPELCGACEATDSSDLKERIERMESGLKKLGFIKEG